MSALPIENVTPDATIRSRNEEGENSEALRIAKENHSDSFDSSNSDEQSEGENAAREIRETLGLPEPTAVQIERRQAVNSSNHGTMCYRCRHEFTADQPVYRARTYLSGFGLFRGYAVRMLTYCEGCEPHRYYADGHCSTCKREVYLVPDMVYRKRFFCSEACSKAYYAKVQRERRVRPELKDCQQCGEQFIPPRSDTKFCGVACKQRAYRTRRAAS